MSIPEFSPFPKLSRLFREVIITEKIDGTNSQVTVLADGRVLAGSRNRWITPGKTTDNYGFAAWVAENRRELREGLGEGTHFGEWWGQGIQRGYGQDRKRLSLFNVHRWGDKRPACCDVVPLLYRGVFSERAIEDAAAPLLVRGSVAAPGFEKPEGIVVFHVPSNQGFKYTFGGDGHKGARKEPT
jgi:hypothetical protein